MMSKARASRRAAKGATHGRAGADRPAVVAKRPDALVAPTGGPGWVIDLANGDHDTDSAATLPAVAGTLHLSVPMGEVDGLPVGLFFIGPAWSEGRLLGFGAAFEQVAEAHPRPNHLPTTRLSAAQEALLSPVGK